MSGRNCSFLERLCFLSLTNPAAFASKRVMVAAEGFGQTDGAAAHVLLFPPVHLWKTCLASLLVWALDCRGLGAKPKAGGSPDSLPPAPVVRAVPRLLPLPPWREGSGVTPASGRSSDGHGITSSRDVRMSCGADQQRLFQSSLLVSLVTKDFAVVPYLYLLSVLLE